LNAIVTGGAGFIGSHVAQLLISAGHRVLAIDDLSGGFISNVPTGADFEEISVLNPLDELFHSFRPECVYHLAAYAAEGLSHHIPKFTYTNNLQGTVNVLNSAYNCRARHFVLTSSIAVYGHVDARCTEDMPCVPCDPYGVAKLASEQHLRAFEQYYGGPDYTILRPHNVFGPRQNIEDPYRNAIGIFFLKAMRNQPLPVFGDGSQTRSFSFIRSVARCIADAPFTPNARNETLNIGSDEPMSVRELALSVCEVMGIPPLIAWLPPRTEVLHAHCSHSKAHSVFPHAFGEPVAIRAGLELTLDYLLSSSPLRPSAPRPTIEISDRLPPSWR
jgi:UDP-glucose 4-epimerase